MSQTRMNKAKHSVAATLFFCTAGRLGTFLIGAALQFLSEMSWRGFPGKVLVCMAARRAGFGNRRVACAVFNRRLPIRSWKRSRTLTVEKLRVRDPVNNGPRNHRTFSREQLATVHDANSQETSTIRHRPCHGSPYRFAINKRCGILQTSYRNLRQYH